MDLTLYTKPSISNHLLHPCGVVGIEDIMLISKVRGHLNLHRYRVAYPVATCLQKLLKKELTCKELSNIKTNEK